MADKLYVNEDGSLRELGLQPAPEFAQRIEALEQQNAAQDEAIDSKVSTVNGLTPDSNGNVDVGGMPLGTLMPYTGKDVPAGTLRADGATYTNMRSSFPEFYEWVVESGLTVPIADYALVEGSCGYYGLDTSAGTVRMPTLAAGVFGTVTAGQYGQAVRAGLPNITGSFRTGAHSPGYSLLPAGAFYESGTEFTLSATGAQGACSRVGLSAELSNSIYGNSDTVTPSHVKYPWVIVVYNAAVPPSVAQAGEFMGMLDGKADKTQLDTVVAPGFVMPFAANIHPAGYLLCNGAAVSRTTYAKLFEVIGTTYGAGDGSSTFNLPNLTDKFIQGSTGVGINKEAGLPNVYGNAVFRYGSLVSASGAFSGPTSDSERTTLVKTDSSGNLSSLWLNAQNYNSIYGNSSTVQPPALTMRYYIKY